MRPWYVPEKLIQEGRRDQAFEWNLVAMTRRRSLIFRFARKTLALSCLAGKRHHHYFLACPLANMTVTRTVVGHPRIRGMQVVATRDILVGEEITVPMANDYFGIRYCESSARHVSVRSHMAGLHHCTLHQTAAHLHQP